MAETSSVAWEEALLGGGCSESIRALARQLERDPPLALWAVCQARRAGDPRLTSLDQVARWLAGRAVEALAPEDFLACLALPAGTNAEEALNALLHASLEAGHCAVSTVRQVSEVEWSLAESPEYLARMLHNARAWLDLATDEPARSAEAVPDWLHDLFVELEQSHQSTASSVSESVDLEGCRRRAEASCLAWRDLVPGQDRLWRLLAILSRLRRLESRFDEALETEKLEAMAELAAGAGHEINNPLAVIAGRAQLLLRDEPDPERRRELASINAQVKRAHEMIADMRLFARPPAVEFQKVEMVALVDRLLAELGPQAAERAIAIHRGGHPGPIEIEADPVQWNVALQAICRNAIEAIGQDGQIEILLEVSDPWLVIQVSDDGPGFSEQERRHLFDPFFSARQAGRGLGLGLSKCWRIVTGHDGRIEAANRPGGGAVFSLWIPRGR